MEWQYEVQSYQPSGQGTDGIGDMAEIASWLNQFASWELVSLQAVTTASGSRLVYVATFKREL